ncbi:MAG: hypothetical protein GTN80_08840 [Nitrososphaeria archaeon]|nr:hypothetical protein [Nitrososphaeria archaeon]NIN53274.1 hypothetical protein [Nitrososphaeria archaeon]NIQ33725.1 hypothetical protein [Nitrososphaeria archaeon]
MRAAGITVLEDNAVAADMARAIVKKLLDAGFNVSIYPRVEGLPPRAEAKTNRSEVSGDFIVTIGGDGTILRAFQSIRPQDTPILGIGSGEKNFLAMANKENYEEAIEAVIEGKYFVKREMRLDVNVEGRRFPPVLNEVYFASSLPGKTIEVHVEIRRSEKRIPIWHDRGDGIIIATPTGSTAYSLSAGGPIVDTSLQAITVTPMSLRTHKPSIVLPNSDEVILWAGEKKAEAIIVLDGQIGSKIGRNKEVFIRKSDKDAYFIVFRNQEMRYVEKTLRIRP